MRKSTTEKRDEKLLGVRIDRDLHKRARVRAAQDDTSLAEVVRTALELYLEEGPAKKSA